MPIDSWDDERVATLVKMWAGGHSVTRIAVVLECSRGAVVGKISRMKLPPPLEKLPVIIDRSYSRQCPEISLMKRRERERRYAQKRREQQKHDFEHKREIRAQFLAKGASTTSVAYRKHLPVMPEMSKAEMRAMLAQAAQNTATL